MATLMAPGALVILVVEDEYLVRQIIVECLRDAGYVVLEAETGEEAIAMCGSENAIDVLFTDIQLNGSLSGWEVAERFRATRNGMPVVYTSGNRQDRTRCVPDSVFFDKPYHPAEVLRICRQLTSTAKPRRADAC